ncbi:hypothetical protein BH20ACT9_BH20ACT9_22260 [soil metagenome]
MAGDSEPARGPGPHAPDGSPVELYALLPPGPEVPLLCAALPPGSRVLELGCGAGRVTRPLVAHGCRVVAVDESPEMLAHVRDVTPTVRADIRRLDLAERFDGVVLGSHLVNTPDPGRRAALLAACRRHVADGGVVLVQRHDPGLGEEDTGTTVRAGPVAITLRSVRRDGDRLSATVAYTAGARAWTHTFTAEVLDEETLRGCLGAAGLRPRRWLDAGRQWLEAVPGRGRAPGAPTVE